MLVGDLVYNDDFDINTNYAVKPLAAILDLKIKYITTDGDCIIIEGEKRS